MIDEALSALKEGKVILLYDFDNREKETDFAILSSAVTPETIWMFRKDGGGLICTAISGAAARRNCRSPSPRWQGLHPQLPSAK